jgi:hypothetical protein
MMQLVLTGLGNEVDLKSGKTVFTAVFNNSIRIEISKEAAQTLTSNIYGGGGGAGAVIQVENRQEPDDDYSRPPVREAPSDEAEEFGGDVVTGDPQLEDAPRSVYDEDTGVEQV